MNSLLSIATGYRTYATIAIGIVYLVGSKLGFWALDPELLAMVGLFCAGFLRSAIDRASEETSPTPARPPIRYPSFLLALCILSAGIVLTGCSMLKTTVKVPVYVITPGATETISEDAKVVARNRAYTLWDAKETLAKYSTRVAVTTNKIDIAIGFQSLSQESSGSNVVKAIEAAGGAAGTIIHKSATGQ